MATSFGLDRRVVLRAAAAGAAGAAASSAGAAPAAAQTATRDVAVRRLSLVSAKPFDAVVATFESAIGHPNMPEFLKDLAAAKTSAELHQVVERAVGKTGLMEFVRFDLGLVIAMERGGATRSLRFLVGNPVIMSAMARYVPDAGSYAPVTVLIDERADGVHLSYDTMASLLAPYGDAEALRVARDLDAKIENLLKAAAA
jgi:hypothetical protein